jgi:hypothetical protein
MLAFHTHANIKKSRIKTPKVSGKRKREDAAGGPHKGAGQPSPGKEKCDNLHKKPQGTQQASKKAGKAGNQPGGRDTSHVAAAGNKPGGQGGASPSNKGGVGAPQGHKFGGQQSQGAKSSPHGGKSDSQPGKPRPSSTAGGKDEHAAKKQKVRHDKDRGGPKGFNQSGQDKQQAGSKPGKVQGGTQHKAAAPEAPKRTAHEPSAHAEGRASDDVDFPRGRDAGEQPHQHVRTTTPFVGKKHGEDGPAQAHKGQSRSQSHGQKQGVDHSRAQSDHKAGSVAQATAPNAPFQRGGNTSLFGAKGGKGKGALLQAYVKAKESKQAAGDATVPAASQGATGGYQGATGGKQGMGGDGKGQEGQAGKDKGRGPARKADDSAMINELLRDAASCGMPLTPMQIKMAQKLQGAQFRMLNEELYTTSSKQVCKHVNVRCKQVYKP